METADNKLLVIGQEQPKLPEGNSDVAEYMKNLFKTYETLRYSPDGAKHIPFWDLIVISAGDEDQKTWYEWQIEEKFKNDVGPFKKNGNIKFLVFADANGIRTGDGGSTLNIIRKLEGIFGEEIFEMKTLLIHAGGYSKRLPSHSFTSKLFAALPIDTCQQTYEVLDMKLVNYLPFCNLMESGMFITASDDLETMFIKPSDYSDIKREIRDISVGSEPFLCSLAHPSSLQVGTGHGVFKMNMDDVMGKINGGKSAFLTHSCLEVLQKPSISKMREKNMTFKSNDQEVVLTDSAYWINPALMKKFRDFSQKFGDVLSVETSIYSDFMSCQGIGQDKEALDIIEKNQNSKVLLDIYHMMNKVKLYLLVLNQSKFYHLGTMCEYLDGFSNDLRLKQDMNFRHVVNTEVCAEANTVQGIVISSLITKGLKVPNSVVIECCKLYKANLTFSINTILSHVTIDESFVYENIPGDHIYYTVPIQEGDAYVTIAFHVKADLKKNLTESQDERKTLWDSKLFPSGKNPVESFAKAIEMIENNRPNCSDEKFYSMQDLMNVKDQRRILQFRSSLLN